MDLKLLAVFVLGFCVNSIEGNKRFECEDSHAKCMTRKMDASLELIQPCFIDNDCSNPMCVRYGLDDYMNDNCPNLSEDDITKAVMNTIRGVFKDRRKRSVEFNEKPKKMDYKKKDKKNKKGKKDKKAGKKTKKGKKDKKVVLDNKTKPLMEKNGCNWGKFFTCASKVYTEIMRGPTAPLENIEYTPDRRRRRKRSTIIHLYLNFILQKFDKECTIEGGRKCKRALQKKMTEDEKEESENRELELNANVCECLDQMNMAKLMDAMDNGCEGEAPGYVTRNLPMFVHAMGNEFCPLENQATLIFPTDS